MNPLIREIRRNPMLWLLAFVPVVFAAAKLEPEAQTVLFVLSVLAIVPLAALQFQALGVTFAGYMTPQGHLRMSSGYGPTVDADFDAQTRTLRGRANSVNCRYDVAWQKTA
jgi:hypothetical protein